MPPSPVSRPFSPWEKPNDSCVSLLPLRLLLARGLLLARLLDTRPSAVRRLRDGNDARASASAAVTGPASAAIGRGVVFVLHRAGPEVGGRGGAKRRLVVLEEPDVALSDFRALAPGGLRRLPAARALGFRRLLAVVLVRRMVKKTPGDFLTERRVALREHDKGVPD